MSPPPLEWSDAELLDALSMADQGDSFAEIGRRLNRSRSAVCSVLKRIRDQDIKQEPAAREQYRWDVRGRAA